MTDYAAGLTGPATHIFDIVPDDDDPLPVAPRAIIAAAAGTITLRARDSAADVAVPVVAGQRIPAIITHIRATGTDVDVIGLA